ncbi:MAG TPA: bifunctional glutamate N-acetyltransferase/amino-acid acetyltransferase ArgJ [Acidimicrobiales bacterium]|jgi:glutamate N-acetyltransferase/amino-acid N-acetyltransferase|nr:bifunctional glutamate N-acetyltransferase/amino-acid acetyltransferase ArgJ [Acidimicrobiales bacterium]
MSVVAPRGFAAAGAHLGIKSSGAPDCAVVACTADTPANAAAVFTSNLAAAAPVIVSRAHLAATGGRVRAVVLTSGNANAATGKPGRRRAEGLCATVAGSLGASSDEVLVAQTGLIGVPFEFERCDPGLRDVCGALGASTQHGDDAALAIMTTDTRPKTFSWTNGSFTVGAMAKGVAMLAPTMATMLAVLTTDAACEPGVLAGLLHAAVAPTFNSVHVDGDTSTNDTVVVLASGSAGHVDPDLLGSVLSDACASLAHEMVADAEGATKLATVSVYGARSDHEAHVAARAVAGSLLVKCSLNGADPYWGRVVSSLGAAGVGFDMDRVAVGYGGTVVCAQGVGVDHDATAVVAHLSGREVSIECDLGLGDGVGAVLCCDLGEGYLAENRTTS